MRIGGAILFVMAFAGAVAAQTKGSPAAQTKDAPAPAAPLIEANMLQLMRGVFYPASNVVFYAQNDDPAKFPPAKDPSLATDPLASTFGKWVAVENSALALADAANLLMLPGRKCGNGVAVPIGNADWPKFVQELRDAGMKAYAAAQAKDTDKIIDASDALTDACAHCHRQYREKRNPADRCK
jgi:hypothetical protein